MKTVTKNLVILFPGTGYTTDRPLLYYADFTYRAKGYERMPISYGDCIRKDLTLDEVIENIKTFILPQVESIDFAEYDDIVFVSKSIGTIIAGWLADRLGARNIRHIYLTPTSQTLQYITHDKNISMVVSGTKDKFIDADVLKNHCKQEKIKLELIEGACHSLEILDDISASINILKRIVDLYT